MKIKSRANLQSLSTMLNTKCVEINSYTNDRTTKLAEAKKDQTNITNEPKKKLKYGNTKIDRERERMTNGIEQNI